MTKTVAVTGATGFVGANFVRAFAAQGWIVLALTRRPNDYRSSAQIRFVPFDLARAGEVNLEEVDVLIHCALEPYTDTMSPNGLNVRGSKQLFEAARVQGVKQIVFLSSTASRASTTSEYGAEKYAVEQMLDPAADLIIRPGLVVGDGGLLRSMYRTIAKYRIAPLFFGGKKPVYSISLYDLTSATIELVERRVHGLFTLCAEAITMKLMYEELARKANVHVRFISLPYRPVLRLVQSFERMGVRLPLSSGSMKGVATTEYLDIAPSNDLSVRIRPFSEVLQTVTFSEQ